VFISIIFNATERPTAFMSLPSADYQKTGCREKS